MYGLVVGDEVTFAKTVSESDVYLFAGITGDFAPNHVNEEAMSETPFGTRIVHGALLLGFMSTCSTMISAKAAAAGCSAVPLSAGFDKIRFLKPVFIGDTVTLRYRIEAIEEARGRAFADIDVTTQSGGLVAVACHILQWAGA